LPLLNGPERAKKRVMQNYQQFNRLLRPHGHEVARLEMRDRGSWFLTTRGGIEMLLGRVDVLDKMQRFLTIDRLMLAERRERIAREDLRYSNGLAVAWREPATENGESRAIMASKQGSRMTVGLAIGTSEVAAHDGEIGTDGELEIVGIGSHPSRGMKKGVVVNIESTVQSIQRAIEEAELMAGCQIHSVYAGIAGNHIRSM